MPSSSHATCAAVWRADGHVCLANTAAILHGAVADVPGTEPAPGGGFTGRVRMEANDRLHRWFAQTLSDHEVQELQLRAAGLAAVPLLPHRAAVDSRTVAGRLVLYI